jgi:hypothetical protein
MILEDGEKWAEMGFDAIAVGWLGAESEFRTGAVPRNFFSALIELLANPWQPAVSAGRHPCELCQFTDGPTTVAFGGSAVDLGGNILFVPSTGLTLFAAPSLIAHYIDAHRYEPPEDFMAAVTECPPMRSMEYLKSLKRCGARAPQRG